MWCNLLAGRAPRVGRLLEWIKMIIYTWTHLWTADTPSPAPHQAMDHNCRFHEQIFQHTNKSGDLHQHKRKLCSISISLSI